MRRFLVVPALGLAVAAGAAGGGSVVAQPATPVGEMVAAGECTTEPRPAGFFEQLAATPGATPSTPVGQAGSPTPFAMPQGQPADQATVDAVTETERQVVACLNAGDYLRVYALYSDNYVRQNVPAETIGALPATPVPAPETTQLVLQAVREVVLLPDGRAAALIDLTGPQAGGAVTTTYAVFAQVDGRWLIDEETVVQAGAATPAA